MQGKICLITGATNGIGKETALGLARMGATVVIVGRSSEKCAAVAAEIERQTGNPAVDWIAADLSAMGEVRRAADEFRAKYSALHVLINNAGAIYMKRETSADGYEKTFALNHMSYFLLTDLLLDMLKASAPARIINVSSDAHRSFPINLDNPQNPSYYSGFRAYSYTKLMNVMFTYELARRLEGTGVTANALHPGFVRTGFGQNNSRAMRAIMTILQRFALSPAQGAETPIYLASSAEVEGVTGRYFSQKKAIRSSKASYDQAAWTKLWALSERLVSLPVA